MSNYLESETAVKQWLGSVKDGLVEALNAAGVAFEKKEFEELVSTDEAGVAGFWDRQRSGGVEVERVVLWVLHTEHTKVIGATTTGEFLPSVTVGTIDPNAPLRVGWSRFQEYKHSSSAGPHGIKLKTVVSRVRDYTAEILAPRVAGPSKPAGQQGDQGGNTASSAQRENDELPLPLRDSPILMSPPEGGMCYVHIPMTRMPTTFALALEALLRGSQIEVSRDPT